MLKLEQLPSPAPNLDHPAPESFLQPPIPTPSLCLGCQWPQALHGHAQLVSFPIFCPDTEGDDFPIFQGRGPVGTELVSSPVTHRPPG